MDTKILLLGVLGLVSSLGLAKGEGLPIEAPRTYEEAIAVLPQSERHHFLAVSPAWRKRVIVVDAADPSGERVQKPSDRPQKPPLRIFYSERITKTTWYPYIKTLCFRPGGKILSETDDIPVAGNPISDDCYTRTFSPDGSIRSYLHQRQSSEVWISGVEIDPQTKKENHFSNGVGTLTTYDNAASTTRWFHDYAVFLQSERTGSQHTQFELHYFGNQETLNVTRKGESLAQFGIYWTRETGDTPVWHGPSMIRHSIDIETLLYGAGANEASERQQILALWKNIYENLRRPDFVNRYTDVLAAAGQSWQSLGIEFIRDNAPWPDE